MKELQPGDDEDLGPDFNNAASPLFRVLVADDNEAERRLTIWHLGKAWPDARDMVVECAGDGTEALEKIRSNAYRLVVLDWNMPLRDGGEVLRAIRDDGLCVPVVVVSGQPREAIALDLEAGAAAFVSKGALNPMNFGSAIAVSMQLQEERCSCESSRRKKADTTDGLGVRTFNIGDGSDGENTP